MPITDFTYESYTNLLLLIRDSGYQFADYHNNDGFDHPCILRHDVDNDLNLALKMARIEHELGIKSSYFVLLRTDFYNVFSKASIALLDEIASLGHEIGLHFDETAGDYENVPYNIAKECNILQTIGINGGEYMIRTVSMHRPSPQTLAANIRIDGIVNSYSEKYFSEYKYLSDSRMHWREDAEGIITSGQYDKLHILTHPFWYSEKMETTKEKLVRYFAKAKLDRYKSLSENFRDISEFVRPEDLK